MAKNTVRLSLPTHFRNLFTFHVDGICHDKLETHVKTPCVQGIGFSTVVRNIILLLYLKYYTWRLTEHENLIIYDIGT